MLARYYSLTKKLESEFGHWSVCDCIQVYAVLACAQQREREEEEQVPWPTSSGELGAIAQQIIAL